MLPSAIRPVLVAALLGVAPAAGAQDQPPAAEGAPTSILPEAFDAPTAGAPLPPVPATVAERPPTGPAAAVPQPGEAQAASDAAPEPLEGPVRPAAAAGLLSPATLGLAAGAYAGADGRFLAALLARLDGPLASRWAQIAVIRALVSQARPPEGIHPGDWLAARTRALVALGAAAEAHRMVGRVRLSDYTPRLLAAAAEAALAAGDPLGLCPFAAQGRQASDDNPAFVLADALCAGVAGDPFSANQLFEAARRQRIVDPFDIQLAERVTALAGSLRNAGNPVWAEVDRLTAWRVGLAGAAGVEVPEAMLAAAPARARLWMLRMPRVPVARRAALAPEGAAFGVLSGAEIARILALDLEGRPAGEAARSPGSALRAALSAPRADERVAALKALLAPAGGDALGLRVAAGAAAARIAPSAAFANDAPLLIEAMLAAGHGEAAADWWPVLEEADPSVRARAYALLAPVAAEVTSGKDLLDRFARETSPARAERVRAGLHGLGLRLGEPPPPIRNAWTDALDAAVAARRPGEILVVAAAGLQGRMSELVPDQFRRIVAAFVAAGLGEEARLMVAEAAMRD
ncbi:hypothetical protein [Thermaurantiacus sp.]